MASYSFCEFAVPDTWEPHAAPRPSSGDWMIDILSHIRRRGKPDPFRASPEELEWLADTLPCR